MPTPATIRSAGNAQAAAAMNRDQLRIGQDIRKFIPSGEPTRQFLQRGDGSGTSDIQKNIIAGFLGV